MQSLRKVRLETAQDMGYLARKQGNSRQGNPYTIPEIGDNVRAERWDRGWAQREREEADLFGNRPRPRWRAANGERVKREIASLLQASLMQSVIKDSALVERLIELVEREAEA